MASRSFIFRKFLCALHEILWHDKLRCTRTHTVSGHSFRLLRPISTPTENAPLARLVPAAHGMGRQRPQSNSGGPGIAWGRSWVRSATPPTHRPIHSHYPVFCCYKGVCRVLGGMLQPTYRPRPRTSTTFPGTMNGWHHVASFSESFYAATASIFDQKNYGTRTDTVSGHSFRLLCPISTPTENAPLARL